MSELIRDHLAHVIAAVSLVGVLGVARLTRAFRHEYGPQRASQAILFAWTLVLLVMVYQAPESVGVFALGLVVFLFGDTHLRAWVAEQLGGEAYLRPTHELLRRRGRARYVAVLSIRAALQASVGVVMVALSTVASSWEYWLGLGLLTGAALGFLGDAQAVWRVGRARTVAGSSGAE